MGKNSHDDDMRPDQFFTTPTDELEHGLRCVIYEMLVLALALVQLKNKSGKYPGLPFGEEQSADTAALLKARVLLDFLFEADAMPDDLKTYFRSVHKWTAHLTWQRVRKGEGFPQPFPEDILMHGKTVLDLAAAFVAKCQQDHGYRLSSRNATGYLAKYQELYAQLAAKA
jgi:hypothetical protein